MSKKAQSSVKRNYIPIYFKKIVAYFVVASGVVSAFFQLKDNVSTDLDYLLTVFLFLFGFTIVIQAEDIFSTTSQYEKDTALRKKENELAKKAFWCLHEITERIRDYRTLKHIKGEEQVLQNDDKIRVILKEICQLVITNYLEPKYGDGITVCIKYKRGDKMIAIRKGKQQEQRNQNAENLDDCHLYKFLTQDKDQSKAFLRVNDTTDQDELKRIFGDTTIAKKIAHRAELQGYKTFMALVINTGDMMQDDAVKLKDPLGFVGVDCDKANAFNKFRDYEKDFLAAIADATSELLWDIRSIEESGV